MAHESSPRCSRGFPDPAWLVFLLCFKPRRAVRHVQGRYRTYMRRSCDETSGNRPAARTPSCRNRRRPGGGKSGSCASVAVSARIKTIRDAVTEYSASPYDGGRRRRQRDAGRYQIGDDQAISWMILGTSEASPQTSGRCVSGMRRQSSRLQRGLGFSSARR